MRLNIAFWSLQAILKDWLTMYLAALYVVSWPWHNGSFWKSAAPIRKWKSFAPIRYALQSGFVGPGKQAYGTKKLIEGYKGES